MEPTLTTISLDAPAKNTAIKLYEEMKDSVSFEPLIFSMRRANPDLSEEKAHMRIDALMQWLASLQLNRTRAAKPFQMIETVDEAWHAFILHSRAYSEFSERYFGEYLHHDPPLEYESDRTEYATYTLAALRNDFGNRISPELENLAADVKCCNRGHK
jgi:hypothetical protein